MTTGLDNHSLEQRGQDKNAISKVSRVQETHQVCDILFSLRYVTYFHCKRKLSTL